jgi:hypothetical protein
MTDAELVEYYKDLLIIQYRDKPRARETVGLFVSKVAFLEILRDIQEAYEIETAAGDQLDTLAHIVGAERIIDGVDFIREYFGYVHYGEIAPFVFNGFIAYGTTPPDIQVRDYMEKYQSSFTLVDEELRTLIKIAIVRNNSNASLAEADALLAQFFGENVYIEDRMDMSIVYYYKAGADGRILNVAAALGLLPRPAGVSAIIAEEV